jgi:hypothetical protein
MTCHYLEYLPEDEPLLRRIACAFIVLQDEMDSGTRSQIMRQAIGIYDRKHTVQLTQQLEEMVARLKP